MKYLFVLGTLLGIAGYTTASCFVRQRVVAPVVVKEQVVQAVATVIAPVAVYAPIPAYSAVYTPPPETADLKKKDVDLILKALEALDSRLKALENKKTETSKPPETPKKDEPPLKLPPPKQESKVESSEDVKTQVTSLFQKKCALCHASQVSAEKGGGFTLLENNQIVKLDDRQLKKVVTMSYTAKMPPKNSIVTELTNEEVALIVGYVDSLK